MNKVLILLFPVLALVGVSAEPVRSDSSSSRAANQSHARTPQPAFILPDLAGASINLEDEQRAHKAVLIAFWATWCAGCVQEIPQLEELDLKYRDRGLRVLTVNAGDERSLVESFAAKRSMELPILLDDHVMVTKRFEHRTDGSIVLPNIVLRCFGGQYERTETHLGAGFLKDIEKCLGIAK